MNYALIENGIVTNTIWLHPANADDFPSAVKMGDYPVQIGDRYEDGVWYREGVALKTQAEMLAEELKDAEAALNMLGVKADE